MMVDSNQNVEELSENVRESLKRESLSSEKKITKNVVFSPEDKTLSDSIDVPNIPEWAIPGNVTEDMFGFYKKIGEINTDKPQLCAEGVVKRYTFSNRKGVIVQIINYGATVTSFFVPDMYGLSDDILLGFDNMEGYISNPNHYFGATIGRVAGIISDGVITLKNKDYFLSNNFQIHHFNGGYNGLDKVLWDSYIDKDSVIMTYISPNDDEGYPGSLSVQLSFQLTNNNLFIIHTKALTSQPSPVNITNQLYINLAGHGSGPSGLKEHTVVVNADKFIVKDKESNLPTGELENVGSTFYDLRVPRPLDKVLTRLPGGGYNETFCLTKGFPKKTCSFAARLVHPESGRFLEIITDLPALNVYTANDLPMPEVADASDFKEVFDLFSPESYRIDDDFFLRKKESSYPRPSSDPEEEHHFETYSEIPSRVGSATSLSSNSIAENFIKDEKEKSGKEEIEFETKEKLEGSTSKNKIPSEILGKMGCSYKGHGAICLMPMEYPDALKHKNFPSPIVYPGELYERTVIYKVGILHTVNKSDLIKVAAQVPPPSNGFVGTQMKGNEGSESEEPLEENLDQKS